MQVHVSHVAAMLALLLSTAFAWAADETPLNSAMTDVEFLRTAAASDEFERQSGQIAANRAESASVRELGERLILDHTESTQLLAAAAAEAGLEIPAPELHPGLERKLAELAAVAAELFDETFLQIQAEGHVDARALMRTCVQVCEADPIRSAAEQILPVINEHLAHTLELQRTLGE